MQLFSVGDFVPQGTFGNVWRRFGLSPLGGRMRCYWHLLWAEARDAAKGPAAHKTAP